MTKRIYIVTNGTSDPRLVRAENQAQVSRHLVQPFKIAFPSQDELLAARDKGIKVEDVATEGDAQ
jgi:hypothetical protein